MNIRSMSIHDYESVCQLWRNTKGMGLNSVDDSYDGIARYLSRNPTTCFVAEEASGIHGAILCGHDGRRGFIYHLAVEQSRRNCGIGKALLEAALAALEKEGIAKAALVVFSRNAEGNSFWEKRGFMAREDLTYRDKVMRPAIRMDT